MANNSEKKLQKQKEKYGPLLTMATSGFLIFYFLTLLLSTYKGTLQKTQIFLFILYTVVNIFCYKNLLKGIEMGLNLE